MTALRVLPPHDYVGAEAIAEVVESWRRCCLRRGGVVEDAEYPDEYFRADATVQFGYGRATTATP